MHEALELGTELRLLFLEPGVLAAHVTAAPHCVVQLVKEATVGATEVNDLRPQLGELPLLAHARPPGGLPVGDHPPPPPLVLCHHHAAAVGIISTARAGWTVANSRCFVGRFKGRRRELEGSGRHGDHVAMAVSVECWVRRCEAVKVGHGYFSMVMVLVQHGCFTCLPSGLFKSEVGVGSMWLIRPLVWLGLLMDFALGERRRHLVGEGFL